MTMGLLRRFKQSRLNESEEVISLAVQPKSQDHLAGPDQSQRLNSYSNPFSYEPTPIAEDVLANIINEPDPNHRLRFTGWKVGATAAAAIGFVTLIINLAALAWLKRHPNVDGSLVEVYHGDCHRVEQLQIWSHLAINALSTVLLSGSNYCMQVLCAPTRRELDHAHAKRRYLDIGVQSIRNLRWISPYRAAVWWILGLSSIPLHLMYNSSFYSSIGIADYRTIFVTQGFLEGEPFAAEPDMFSTIDPENCRGNTTCISAVEDMLRSVQVGNDRFHRLDREACLVAYANVLLTDRSNLVLVTTNDSPSNETNSLLADRYLAFNDAVDLQKAKYKPFDWICFSSNRMNGEFEETRDYPLQPCDAWYGKIVADMDKWTPYDFDIDHCLSEQIEERCSFNGNKSILIFVIVFNALKIICMLWVAFGLGHGHGHGNSHISDLPLITIGDAIASYLHTPDPVTKNYGMWSRSDFRAAISLSRITHANAKSKSKPHTTSTTTPPTPPTPAIPSFVSNPTLPTSKPAHLTPHRYHTAATRARWTWTLLFLLLAIIIVLSLLGAGLSQLRAHNTPISALGFGKIHASALVNGWGIVFLTSTARKIASAVLVANLPQTILSFLYLHLNGLVTCMALTAEMRAYARGPYRGLRVSLPRERTGQTGTWFLQLPYSVGVPLMVLSGLLHWLVSQSFFLAVVAEYAWDGRLVDATAVATCGFSLVPMMVVLGLGAGIVVALVGAGWGARWAGTGMPLGGSCSLVLSAACHPLDGDQWVEYRGVRWGVVEETGDGNDGVGRCSFTSAPVGEVVEGKQYA